MEVKDSYLIMLISMGDSLFLVLLYSVAQQK